MKDLYITYATRKKKTSAKEKMNEAKAFFGTMLGAFKGKK